LWYNNRMNKTIIANWKMNPATEKEAEKLLRLTKKQLPILKDKTIVVCPPFPYLFLYKNFKSKKFLLGAQNVSNEEKGSYTGEVSPSMLSSMGASHVIIGHGECRARGEDDSLINRKILNLLKNDLIPVLCVGERDRDAEGSYLSFLEEQLKQSLNGLNKNQIKKIIIAYEPLWAIGGQAKREATKEEFTEIKIFIKKILSDMYDPNTALSVPVLFGGSVNSINARYYVDEGGADGLLVGRDSLDADKFEAIVRALD